MTDIDWLERRADTLRQAIDEAKARRKAAERACDAAGIIEGDTAFERACTAYEHANNEVLRYEDELYDIERQIGDSHARDDNPVGGYAP